MKERVAIYVRVSTEEQKRFGLSLDAQEERLREYAEKHGLHIVKAYRDEGHSARKGLKKRPVMMQMLDDVKKGEFTRILFWRLDRFFRNVADYHYAMRILEEHGVTWTTTDEKYDMTTSSGRFLINAKVSIAEMEADQTSERIKLTNDYKVRRGAPLTGAMPFGFSIIKTEDGKRVVKDAEKAPIVDDLLRYFLAHHTKRGTMVYINEKYGINISYHTVSTLLKNPLLCGRYRDNESYCEGYITPEQFADIEAVLARNVKVTPSNRAYLFTGLIRCPACGRMLTVNHRFVKAKKGYSKKDTEYIMYRCNANQQDTRCPWNHCVNERKLEAELKAKLDAFANARIGELTVSDASEDKVSYERRIAEMKAEQKRLNTMFRKGRIDEKTYDRDYDRLDGKIRELSEKPDPKRDLEKMRELLQSDWQMMYEHLDREHKRSFWRQVCRSISISGDKHLVSVDFN